MLNEVPEFRTALETAQADLREVVRTNQSVEDLTATGMSGVVAGQTGIIEAEKTLEKSTLKGEAAIAATFGALLQPDVVLNTLMVTGLSKEEAIEKVAKDFPEHANLAVDTFASTDRELAGVLYENDRIIAEGQARAEVALQKLDLLNHFVSKSQEETMSINVEAQNKPIQLPQTKEDRQAFIGQELKEAFLERFELLAGTSDEEAHPTLLAQLIGQLGEAGTMAVLGEAIRPEDIFISKKTTGGQELTHKETTLATFKASEEQDPRGIDLLRQKIKQNRTEIELAKRQHLDSQELELRLVDLESSRVQVQSSGGNRFTRFFRNLFGRSNPQEQQLLESPLMSGQHTPRYFEPLSKVGSKRGSFVDLRDLESSQMMMKPKSQMRRIHSSGNLLDLEVDLQQLSSPLKQPVHKHEQEIDLEEEE